MKLSTITEPALKNAIREMSGGVWILKNVKVIGSDVLIVDLQIRDEEFKGGIRFSFSRNYSDLHRAILSSRDIEHLADAIVSEANTKKSTIQWMAPPKPPRPTSPKPSARLRVPSLP